MHQQQNFKTRLILNFIINIVPLYYKWRIDINIETRLVDM